MKTPLIAYQDHAERSGIPPAVAAEHLKLIRKVMFLPPEHESHPDYPATRIVDIEIFAHGPEVMRIAKTEPFAQHGAQQEWLVQSLSAQNNDFITQKSYPFDPDNEHSAQHAYKSAYADAKDLYPAADKADYIEKWEPLILACDTEELVVPSLNSREKLAAFWYESKAIDWGQEPRPFFHEYNVSQYLFSSKAFSRDPSWNDEEYEEIQTYAMNMLSAWGGDELKNVLIGTKGVPIVFNGFRNDDGENIELEFRIKKDLIVLDTKIQNSQNTDLSTSMLPVEFPAIADVRNIDDGDIVRINKALDIDPLGDTAGTLLTAPGNAKILLYADGSEGFFIAHSASAYTISLHDKAYLCDHERLLLDERKFKITDISFENEYRISVYEVKTYADNESGEPDSREELIVGETYTTEELDSLNSRYGLMVPSSSSPDDNYVWFTSASPDENREYFEKGTRTEYEMHLLEINGQSPTPAGLQRFANEMDITFRLPIKLPVFYIDDEVTGTPLEL